LAADTGLVNLYDVSVVAPNNITLSRKKAATVGGVAMFAANDETLNIALAVNEGGSQGVTLAEVSQNTTEGTLESTAQIETATASGKVSGALGDPPRTIKVVVTAAGLPGSPKTIPVTVSAGAEASTWAGAVVAKLNAEPVLKDLYEASNNASAVISLTRKKVADAGSTPIYAANDPTLNVALADDGSTGITPAATSANTTSGGFVSSPQVETATALGPITADSTVQVVVTAAGLPGSPKTIAVPVLENDTASVWAGKVRTELLKPVNGITTLFDVGGSGTSITLTRKESTIGSGIYADNDATLNIALGSSGKGITPALVSANTVLGDANSSKSQVETATAVGSIIVNGNAEVVVTAAGMQGSPKTFSVPVSAGDSPSTWANKVRTALAADSAVSALFEVGGSGSAIVLTRRSLSTLDMQRSALGDPLARSLPTTMDGDLSVYSLTAEQPLDIANYSNLTETRYIHTVGILAGSGPLAGTSVISTYQITNANPTLIGRAAPGILISSSAIVSTVNPTDGSALIEDGEGAPIVWLHASLGTDTGLGTDKDGVLGSRNYSIVPNSAQARALYVAGTQAVIWENADAVKNANGSIPAPIVKHYSRNTTTGALTASPIYLDGSVLLNTPRSTPSLDTWLLTTAEKPSDSTATLRTYALRDGSNIDTDGDGLVDSKEVDIGTDPYDADTDNDGVSDGDEVYPYEIIDQFMSWTAAKADAEARGGWLATIADVDEQKALVRKIGKRTFNSYWLGAADTEATQVETATAAGTITAAGNAMVVVAANGLTGSPKTIAVPVTNGDSAVAWAAKVRAAIVADTAVATLFNVSGSGSEIILARKTWVANDATLNLALSNGTSTGIAAAPNSVDTRASAARVARTFNGVDFAPFTYTLFRPGEPNGTAGLNALSLRNDFKWTDDPATEARSYVVEYPWSDPTSSDTDADGLTDSEERTLKGNPNNPDTDSDGLKDGEEKTAGTSLILVDTDGDGLSDYDEIKVYGTDPLLADTDGDGLEDDEEISLGTNPRDTDTDGDGLLDGDEVSRGTKPKVLDTDQDGLGDGAEVLTHLTNPLVKDSDGDGISDYDEVTKGSNPNDANNPKNIDTDKEGLKDYEELFVYNTDPAKVDTDGDGLSDYDEVKVYGTDPLLVDTDGDGVDDYQEVVILFTDPNGGSFAAGSAGSAVSFSEGRGNYEGLLYNSNDGLGFKLTLNVSAKGAFSGSLEGNFGKAPLRGKLMGDGTWSGRITRGNVGFLRMKLAEQDDGSYGVQGSLETPTGGIYYYQARRAIGFPARKLTFEASRVGDDAGPSGSAVATGTIGKGGKVTQQIYNPDGSRATYAGSVVEGEFMVLYARTKGRVPTVMLGNVALRNNPNGKSNFDGVVRLFNRNYDQERSLSGAYFSSATMGTLPLPAMSLTANNAVLSWSEGRFDGVNKVASWMPNKVTVPTTQNDRAKATFDRKTGLLKLTYTRTDPAKGLSNAQSNAFAVVVQGKDKLSGFYTGAGSSGGFSVQENSAGLQPDFTSISPINKTVSAGGISYNVDVTSTGDWTVNTAGATWVTASVASGTGSGTVRITVNANASNARREASIRIAGFTHTITQSYR
jgi:hypothetical protein